MSLTGHDAALGTRGKVCAADGELLSLVAAAMLSASTMAMPQMPQMPMSDVHAAAQAAAVQQEGSSSHSGERKKNRGACTLCYNAKTACHGGIPCDRCFRANRASQCVERPITEHYRVRQKRQRLEQAIQARAEMEAAAAGQGRDKPRHLRLHIP